MDTAFVSPYPHNWPVCARPRREQHLGTALPLAIQESSFLPQVMTTELHIVVQNEKDSKGFSFEKSWLDD